ncbi:hypothetical protein, partial [Klebsiella pneumoniae]|uniref:hypothetical protein n=1 Tax=Klebsiella pneumoniae TaxID=573 RepID=UPI00352B88EC
MPLANASISADIVAPLFALPKTSYVLDVAITVDPLLCFAKVTSAQLRPGVNRFLPLSSKTPGVTLLPFPRAVTVNTVRR